MWMQIRFVMYVTEKFLHPRDAGSGLGMGESPTEKKFLGFFAAEGFSSWTHGYVSFSIIR